jgi:hypothetical protein
LGWQHILLIIVALIIIASICITSEWRFNREEDTYSGYNKDGSRKNMPYSSDPDIAALMETIRIEGRANRKEEKREDDRKTVTDVVNTFVLITTVGVLLWTCLAIVDQVGEMKKAYQPIADTTQTAKDNMVADHRAWIGPTAATITVPSIGSDVKIDVLYANTGREPAVNMRPTRSSHIYTLDENARGVAAYEWTNSMFACAKTLNQSWAERLSTQPLDLGQGIRVTLSLINPP